MSRYRKTAEADPALKSILPDLFDFTVGSYVIFGARGDMADIGWGELQKSAKSGTLSVQNELYDNFNFRPTTAISDKRQIFAYKFIDPQIAELIKELPISMVRDMLTGGNPALTDIKAARAVNTDRLGNVIAVGDVVAFVPRFGGLRLGRVVKAQPGRQLEIIELLSGNYELCYVSHACTLAIPVHEDAAKQIRLLKNNEIRNFYVTPEGLWR
jgi:hypothetical protein